MSTTERTARKHHECTACADAIEPGETYFVIEGAGRTADGEFWSYREKRCDDCQGRAELLANDYEALRQIQSDNLRAYQARYENA